MDITWQLVSAKYSRVFSAQIVRRAGPITSTTVTTAWPVITTLAFLHYKAVSYLKTSHAVIILEALEIQLYSCFWTCLGFSFREVVWTDHSYCVLKSSLHSGLSIH